jgi:uncharacterized linocin/CFP29 family protein
MTDILRQGFAPLTDEAWAEVNEEATRQLRTRLSGRTLVDVAGPLGWDAAAVNLGRVDTDAGSETNGVQWAPRRVQPLLELRVPFTLSQWELDNASRGAGDVDLAPLEEAAKTLASFEDGLIYNGLDQAGVVGMQAANEQEALDLGKDAKDYPVAVAGAVEAMKLAGVNGPYALVLPPDAYFALTQSTSTGYPLVKVVQGLTGGALKWSPALEHGVVLSQRGGDFKLTLGQDVSIGYNSHTKESIELYITESLTFQVFEPKAAVMLRTPA